MASVVKFAYTSKEGLVLPKEVITAMGIKYDPTGLPSWIKVLTEHQLFKKQHKKRRASPPLINTLGLNYFEDEATAKLYTTKPKPILLIASPML